MRRRPTAANVVSYACLALAVLAPTLNAQDPGEPAAGPEVYASVVGLYELEDGRLLEVFDLADRLGRSQLVALEAGSGRVRTLYPVDGPDDAGDGYVFEAGAAWFVRAPASYRARFAASGDVVHGVELEERGRTVLGRRVRFQEREVTFRSGEVTLAGTIVVPDGPGPHPGVVFVHGSGPATRSGPRYVGDLLAHRGIAVLVYDKRGTGESEGRWQGASYETLAADASAALDRLLAEPGIDRSRVGLFGSSEAGYIVPPIAARRPDDVSLLVCRVCPALPQRQVAPVQQRSALARQGFAPAEVEDALTFHVALMDYAVERTGYAELGQIFDRFRERRWMRRYGFERVPPQDAPYWDAFRAGLTVDPGESYLRLDIPVLIVLGELDDRIAVGEHGAAFREYARRSSNPDFVVEVMPRANHGLFEVRVDEAGEEQPFERYAPEFHALVVDWIAERFLRAALSPGSPRTWRSWATWPDGWSGCSSRDGTELGGNAEQHACGGGRARQSRSRQQIRILPTDVLRSPALFMCAP